MPWVTECSTHPSSSSSSPPPTPPSSSLSSCTAHTAHIQSAPPSPFLPSSLLKPAVTRRLPSRQTPSQPLPPPLSSSFKAFEPYPYELLLEHVQALPQLAQRGELAPPAPHGQLRHAPAAAHGHAVLLVASLAGRHPRGGRRRLHDPPPTVTPSVSSRPETLDTKASHLYHAP